MKLTNSDKIFNDLYVNTLSDLLRTYMTIDIPVEFNKSLQYIMAYTRNAVQVISLERFVRTKTIIPF